MPSSSNELIPGQPRIGWLVDGNASTPERNVMLHNTGEHIELTVPTKYFPLDEYARWFHPQAEFDDDPGKTRFTYSPPRNLVFQDPDGTVVLLGCRMRRHTTNLQVGNGVIQASFAIVGSGDLRYDKVNGVRTEIPGLAQWTGVRSVSTVRKHDPQGRIQSFTINLESQPSIRISRKYNLSLSPSWSVDFPDRLTGTTSARDLVEVHTSLSKPRDLISHLHQHSHIQELLALSAWASFGYLSVKASRNDEAAVRPDGVRLDPPWLPVISHTWASYRQVDDNRADGFLFSFADIGVRGVRRWLSLREEFSEPISIISSLLTWKTSLYAAQITQCGIAFEGLAHTIRKRKGLSTRGTYRELLQTIVDDSGYLPVQDTNEWADRSRNTYIDTKHADQITPDALVCINTLRDNLFVFRCWLAHQLGCPDETLQRNEPLDRLKNRFV